MTKARMQELMREKHPYVAYEEVDLDNFLKIEFVTTNEEMLAWYFVDYLVSQGLAEVVE